MDQPSIRSRTYRSISEDEWLGIHNRSAIGYRQDEWFREKVLGVGKMRRKLFQKATGHVLDDACGYGSNFEYLINAARVTGADFSPIMMNFARKRTRRLGLEVDLRLENAEALNFPDHTFDTVIDSLSTCSFLHPIAALHEMQRVCKRDGKILLLEHGRSSWEWLGRYQDRNAASMIDQGGCHWNQDPVRLIQEAGLRIVNYRRMIAGVFYSMEISPR